MQAGPGKNNMTNNDMPQPHTAAKRMNGAEFQRRLLLLILLAWMVPPLFGMSFLVYIEIFSLEQMLVVMSTPAEPIFALTWPVIALAVFYRLGRPIAAYLDEPASGRGQAALAAMQRFAPSFWGLFLIYLLLAPSVTILSAEHYTDYRAMPVDWFRVHLVALIVSIIVGLPIFFRALDLFGRCLGDIELERPHITIKTKVFLIGALMPLLIDTMIVQYYWTRTGFFSSETFVIWFTLELLAIAGSLMFVQSFGQSLAPLQAIIGSPSRLTAIDIGTLKPRSTDEIGVLTTACHRLLSNTQAYNAILKLNNRMLTDDAPAANLAAVCQTILDMCQQAFQVDTAYIMLHDARREALIGVIETGSPYRAEGHFSLGLEETGMSTWVFHHRRTLAIDDTRGDPRVNESIRARHDAISAMATPLLLGDKAIGVLLISHSGQPRPFREDDILLFEDFAGEIALAVHTQAQQDRQRLAAEELQRLHIRNQLLLESTADGIIGVDREMRCTFSNRAAAEILGYSPEALLNQDFHRLLQSRDEDGEEKPRQDSLVFKAIHKDLGLSSDAEVFWRENGLAVPVYFQASPIHDQGRVTGAVVVFRDITESRAMARHMDYLASHDTLTGLYNRYEFEHRLQQAIDSAHADHVEHILCYLDLDQFKIVNDTCGHIAGDELLRQVTDLLKQKVRQSDALARLGGDEFGVLFDRCPLDKAMEIVEALRRAVEEYRFSWDNKTFTVGVSIGVVTIDDSTENLAQILSAADSACYVAKDRGRNRIHVFESSDEDLNQRHGEMQWVTRINDALANGHFQLSFQPIAPSHEPGNLHEFFEILLVMRAGDGALIPPGAFIPAAERYNLMPAIDRWVVRETFAWMDRHRERLGRVRHCSINLSGHSIGQEDFLAFIQDRIAEYRIDPGQICFEITETAAVANLSRAGNFIEQLRDRGCHFALDDFGSGMSSFAYLKNLPVDFLKIDGHFVRDMANDPIDHAMVEAIHQVGHVMGLKTIAEFVEDGAILERLQNIGIDYAQGYGIAKPRFIGEFFDA